MIDVQCVLDRGNMFFDLRVSGHALADVPGRDVVCAGVSTLVNALSSFLSSVEHEDPQAVIDVYVGNPAIICVRMQNGGEFEALYPVFRMVALGLCGIAESYPAYVQFSFDEVSNTAV